MSQITGAFIFCYMKYHDWQIELNAEGESKFSWMLLDPEASLVGMPGCIAVFQGKRNSREIFYLSRWAGLLLLKAHPPGGQQESRNVSVINSKGPKCQSYC